MNFLDDSTSSTLSSHITSGTLKLSTLAAGCTLLTSGLFRMKPVLHVTPTIMSALSCSQTVHVGSYLATINYHTQGET